MRLQLVERDGRMCIVKVDEKAGTITYEAQCNFTLHAYDAEYCFVGDTDRLGFSKVTCLRIHGGEGWRAASHQDLYAAH